MVSGIEAELLNLLGVFLLAAGVGIAVAKLGRFPSTIALLLAGLAASVLGLEFGITLSRDLILLVLLPPLLFEGAATTDLEAFRANLRPVLALAVPGLLLSILALGFVGQYAFGFPLLVALCSPRSSYRPTPCRSSPCSTSWVPRAADHPRRGREPPERRGRRRRLHGAARAGTGGRLHRRVRVHPRGRRGGQRRHRGREPRRDGRPTRGGHEDIRQAELLAGERKVLRREMATVMDAVQSGTVSDDVGERLLDELDLKLDRVQSGASTVGGDEEGYEEFWRHRAGAFGLEAAELDDERSWTPLRPAPAGPGPRGSRGRLRSCSRG